MYIRTPRLEIHPQRIEANARAVINLCHEHGAQVACVTKVMSAHPAIVHALQAGGADMIADFAYSKPAIYLQYWDGYAVNAAANTSTQPGC